MKTDYFSRNLIESLYSEDQLIRVKSIEELPKSVIKDIRLVSLPGNQNEVIEQIDKECTELFLNLLGKGIIFSPDPEDAMGYSPLGLVIHKPKDKWLHDAHNGHSPENWKDDPELHHAVFPHNGNLWGMTNTPDHAFQKVVFNKERQFGYQVPATPYGIVAMVPEQTNLENVANVEKWLHTDGIYVWKEGKEKYTGKEAADFLRKEFEEAAEQLLFRQKKDAVFMQVLRIDKDHYRLFMLDPGWINPNTRDVVVKIQMEGDYMVKNVLDKKQYTLKNKEFSVKVPAGLFKIIDVEKI